MTTSRKKSGRRAPKKSTATETEGATTHRPFAGLGRERRNATPARPTRPPTPSPSPSRPTKASERFADLVPWVEPIAGRQRRVAAPRATKAEAKTELRFEVIDDGSVVEGRRIDLEPIAVGRMKRGEHACDARLDLHGLSATDARRAVETFLLRAAAEGARMVEIIHGKGLHSVGGIGVLRGELGAWLSQGAAARVVLAFASVRDARGDAGRLRVLLASKRDP